MRIPRTCRTLVREFPKVRVLSSTQRSVQALVRRTFSSNRSDPHHQGRCYRKEVYAGIALVTIIGGGFAVNSFLKKENQETLKIEMEKADAFFSAWCNSQSELDKVELQKQLNTVFNLVKINSKSVDLNMLAPLFYMYGRTIYGADMEAARQIFQLALSFQLPSLKQNMPFSNFESLESLTSHLRAHVEILDIIDSEFRNFTSEALLNDDNDKVYLLATTLRWLGHCYQNLDQFKGPTSENIARFHHIYGMSEALLSSRNLPEFNWELGQLYYNTGRFLHYLTHPDDVEGAVKELQKVLPFLRMEKSKRARVLEAQIRNITMIENSKIIDKIPEAKRKDFLQSNYKDVMIACQTSNQVEGFNPFLKTMFKQNSVNFALKCHQYHVNVATPEELEKKMAEVLEEIKATDYNHYYHSTYFITAAKLAFEINKDKQKALEHLQKAEEIAKKYKDSSAEILETIEDLKRKYSP
jgi:hypothetical protein